MAAPTISYDVHIINPGADLNVVSDPDHNKVTAYYTDLRASDSHVYARCNIVVQYSDVQWTLNSDNSVTVTGNVISSVLTRNGVAQSSSSNLYYDIQAKFEGAKTFPAGSSEYERVLAESSGVYDLGATGSFTVTVPPQTQTDTQASVYFYSKSVGYPQYLPDEFTVGIIVTNPNTPDYRPGKIYDGTTWQSHNRSAGFEKIYTASSSTREMRTRDGGTGENDPPTIYNGAKKNQRKIGNE